MCELLHGKVGCFEELLLYGQGDAIAHTHQPLIYGRSPHSPVPCHVCLKNGVIQIV